MKNNTYTPSHVANYFLQMAHKEGVEITHLKLMKLVYIGYGWVSAILDISLFDDPIEAWQHGPVVNSLYHEFKTFGNSHIQELSASYDPENHVTSYPKIGSEEKEILEVLRYVWDIYKRFSGWDLREKTHKEDTPWSQTYDSSIDNNVIDSDSIKKYFVKKISAYLDD